MANIHILTGHASDAGALSGGAWSASLPLASLQTQQPQAVARSADASLASTRFVLDFGAPRFVGLIALVNHNGSGEALVRYRLSDNADGSSPALDVTKPLRRPNVTWGARPWGAFVWEGYEASIEPGGPIAFCLAGGSVSGRYVLVDIADPGNPAGYVQIGRVLAGVPFVPKFNMTYGAGVGLIDDTKSVRSTGGQAWFERRPQRRTLKASFDALSEAEAWGRVYDLQRRVGLSGNLLVLYDPDDADGTASRRTLYGTLASLADIVTANASVDAPYSYSIAVEELI